MLRRAIRDGERHQESRWFGGLHDWYRFDGIAKRQRLGGVDEEAALLRSEGRSCYLEVTLNGDPLRPILVKWW